MPEAGVLGDHSGGHRAPLLRVPSGIEGVCKWKRTTKVTVSLDKKALKSAHPEEYWRHAKQIGMVTTTVIAKDTGFRH